LKVKSKHNYYIDDKLVMHLFYSQESILTNWNNSKRERDVTAQLNL